MLRTKWSNCSLIACPGLFLDSTIAVQADTDLLFGLYTFFGFQVTGMQYSSDNWSSATDAFLGHALVLLKLSYVKWTKFFE